MAKSPVFTGKELIKSLIKLGFIVVRVKGSYHFYGIEMDAAQRFRYIQKKPLDQVYLIKFSKIVKLL